MGHAPDSFGVRLMKAQSRKNMRVNALAHAVGVRSSHISYLRSDRNKPSMLMLLKLCTVLEVSADFLLGLSDKPELK